MRRLLFFIALWGINLVNAQPRSISFDHLTVEHGMPENYAIDLVQDKNGYIWCGTQRGLVRYDGYNVKVYTQHYSADSTLQINSITSVFLDRKGVIWAGSYGKYLLRYNPGSDDLVIFKPDSTDDNTGSSIFNIVEDAQNNLWFKSYSQSKDAYLLERYNPQTKRFISFNISTEENADIPTEDFIGVFSDRAGRIWINTDNGIYTYDDKSGKFTGYLVSPDMTKKQVLFNLYEPPSNPGVLFMSIVRMSAGEYHPAGFVIYDIAKNKELFFYHLDSDSNSLPNDIVQAFLEDREKRMWIGSSNGLILFNQDSHTFRSYIPAENQSISRANSFDGIKEDAKSNLWLITGPGQGLTYFDTQKKSFTRVKADNNITDGLATNNIEQLYSDRSGNIWLAFRNYGIQRVNQARSRFTVFKQDPVNSSGYPGGSVNSFAETPDGKYWLGTSTGLIKYEPGKGFNKIKMFDDPAFVNATVMHVVLDKEGFIWCRYRGKGLIRYDTGTGSVKNYHYNEQDSTSISNNLISSIYKDRNGVVWIGTDGGGLCRFNKASQNFTRFPYIHNFKKKYTGTALDDETVSAIHEDRYGRLWISTNLGGLNLMDKTNGTFTSYLDESAGLANIIGIQDADSGRLWLGSYFYGLSLFDPSKGSIIKTFNEKNGLLCDVITGLRSDKDGNLWISSDRGLSKINTKTFDIVNFTKLHGLPANEIYPPFVSSSGELYVGYKLGFFTFSPKEIKPNHTLPIINLEAITFFHSKTSSKTDTILLNGLRHILLKYNQNRLTFYFTGIQYENSLLNTYKYKLEGYDMDWIPAGTSRSATYTNLSPATYTFYVKAANMDGIWNENPASIRIEIQPPWWKTGWAYLIFAVLFGVLVWGFILYRSRNLKRENKVLEEKVSHRTNQLQQSLEDLKSTQAQLIQSEKMASLGTLTAGIAHEIQNPLNFVNNFSEINKELLEELIGERSKSARPDNFRETGSDGVNGERSVQSEDELINNIRENEEKINHHGKRADAIVKSMLQHSRASGGQKELTNLNALCDEYIRLAYHGLKAKDRSFEAEFKTELDPDLPKIEVIPQDIGRVLLNLIHNAFQAVYEKNKITPSGIMYQPLVIVSTKRINDIIRITVKDNGPGIAEEIKDKIFQPFFTTKPTGQGTGLGLSMAYDIIKVHNGSLEVKSTPGAGSEFIIQLPV